MKKLVIIKIPQNFPKSYIGNFAKSLKSFSETHEFIFIPDCMDIINYDNDKDLVIASSTEIGDITIDNLVSYLNNRDVK